MAGQPEIHKHKWATWARSAGALLLPLTLLFSTATLAQVLNNARGAGIGVTEQSGLLPEMAIGGTPMISNSRDGLALKMSGPSVLEKNAAIENQFELKDRQAVAEEDVSNEFQDFVAKSVGRKLPMYGFSLFSDVPDTFAPVENIPVTPDYLIGPGDEIVIKAWGQVDIDFHAVVNRNGAIDIPKVGNINMAGIRYQQLQGYLKSAIGRVFRNFDLNVTLGKLRSIQVFVVGQAKRPGVYTVSSLSTLVNTLFASGGPSVKGSLRHIQVKRNGKLVTDFDLYELLLKGDKTKDVALLAGDVIYIPPVGHLVAISGSVNNSAIYEIKDEKTTLANLIELAGGFTTTAAGQKVMVERIADRTMRKVEEFELDKLGLER
ncbi:partial Polysialic acid transport protein KpsD, partial [Gallionellaceae bacterium]